MGVIMLKLFWGIFCPIDLFIQHIKHFISKSLLSVTVLIGLFISTSLSAQTLAETQWMTEQYPPYNFKGDNGQAKGITVDLLLAMIKKAGGTVDRKALRILPWARSYRTLEMDPNTALFSMTYTPEREKLFDFVGPIVSSHVSLIAKKDRHLKIKNVTDINKLKVGVIRDDIGDQLVVKAGVADKHIQRSAKSENMIKKLAAGRVDVIAYDPIVTSYLMKKAGMDPSQYAPVYTLKAGKMGYAFYKGTDPAMLKSLQNALDALKADGTLQKIKNEYLK
jgi:ABC-type amino acid transport substrate-binding protein